MDAEKHVCVHLKCPLLLPNFKYNWNVLMNFIRNKIFQISWKFIQMFLRCAASTDARMDGQERRRSDFNRCSTEVPQPLVNETFRVGNIKACNTPSMEIYFVSRLTRSNSRQTCPAEMITTWIAPEIIETTCSADYSYKNCYLTR